MGRSSGWSDAEVCLDADDLRLLQMCIDGASAKRITIRRRDGLVFAFCGDRCGEYRSTLYLAVKSLLRDIKAPDTSQE